jgi:hypothetical protein
VRHRLRAVRSHVARTSMARWSSMRADARRSDPCCEVINGGTSCMRVHRLVLSMRERFVTARHTHGRHRPRRACEKISDLVLRNVAVGDARARSARAPQDEVRKKFARSEAGPRGLIVRLLRSGRSERRFSDRKCDQTAESPRQSCAACVGPATSPKYLLIRLLKPFERAPHAPKL